jgi:RND family efflux transporter MFP subunit
MKTGKIISTLIGLSFLGTALAFGFWPERRETAITESASTIVQVETVASEQTQRKVRFSGITRAKKHAVLSFSVPARIVERPVEVGNRVAKGQVIARLDVREFDNAVDRSRAVVAELRVRQAQAGRDRQRLKRLIKDGAAATKDFERATAAADALRAALQAAEARLREARRIRSEADLKAPFGGTITAVRLEPGEWAEPGRPVVELSGDSRFELEVDVPETVIGLLNEGERVEVLLPFVGRKKLRGRVDSLARAALSSGRLFPLVVALDPAKGLTAGLTAELILTIRTEPKLLVPVSAVVNPGTSQPSLFVVENDRAYKVAVELGSFNGDRVAVSGDLSAGDRVVVSGHTTLSDGKRVEVRS